MRIFVSVPLSLSLLASGTSAAQAADQPIYELITTAIHRRQSDTALPVTVLGGDALRREARATLGDTLALQPGIANASFGPAVGQPVIRGQQGRRVLTLSNGIANADASGNSADHAQSAEAIVADSIEVLRGPATLLYGTGAIGGVVNVIDRRIARAPLAKPAAALELRYDSATDESTVVGSSDFATGSMVWHVDALQREWNNLDIPGSAIDHHWLLREEAHDDHDHDHDHDDDHHHEEDDADYAARNTEGYIANSGGRTRSWTLGGSWVGERGHIGLAVSRLDKRYGLPPGAHGHAHEGAEVHEAGEDLVSIDMSSTRYDLGAEVRELADWAERIVYRLAWTDYEHAEIEAGHGVGTRFENDAWQQRLQITHTDTDSRHGVLGLQAGSESFAALGVESFIPKTAIRSEGVFLVEDFHRDSLTLEIGARLGRDRYQPEASAAPARSFNTWTFSSSLLWDLNSRLTFGLALSRAERAPSVEELYSNSGLLDAEDCVIHFASAACEIGDTSFGKESSRNVDLTLNFDNGPLSGTLTLFHNRFGDYIGLVATGEEVDGFPLRAYRQDDARFSGVEFDATWQLAETWSLRLHGDSIRGYFRHQGDAPRLPPLRYGLELGYDSEAWHVGLGVLRGEEQDRPGAGELHSHAWTRIDASLEYRLELGGADALLFLRARNLGDEEIRLSTSLLRHFAPEAGRSLEAGLRLSF